MGQEVVPAGACERFAAEFDTGFSAQNAEAMERPFETRAKAPREMRERARRDSDEQFEILAARKRKSLRILAERRGRFARGRRDRNVLDDCAATARRA